MIYNDHPFYFRKNLQGDVIAIADWAGLTVARYTYDAWGKCTIVDLARAHEIATVNPFRYRGYYYDSETQFYYLQSRYYDPTLGRFLNGDEPLFLLLSTTANGWNYFSYCANDCVNRTDSTGCYFVIDDATVVALVVVCAALLVLIGIQGYYWFKDTWEAFCKDVGNGLSWMSRQIFNGGVAAGRWTRKQIKAAINAVTLLTTIEKADLKIKKAVKKSSKSRYWTATLYPNYVDIGRSISYSKAVKEVSSGRNVFTVTCAEAKAVAKAAYSNKKPVGPEIDKGKENTLGYYYHFHVYGRNKKGHVYFLFW